MAQEVKIAQLNGCHLKFYVENGQIHDADTKEKLTLEPKRALNGQWHGRYSIVYPPRCEGRNGVRFDATSEAITAFRGAGACF